MKRLFVTAVIASVVATAAPSSAANVTLTLEIRAGRIEAPPAVTCSVTVAENSSGGAVLARAKATGCIVDYELRFYPGLGNKVVHIDHVREAPDETLNIIYWAMSLNGSYTSYGVDGYQARSGHRLGFTYTTWATCLTPVGC